MHDIKRPAESISDTKDAQITTEDVATVRKRQEAPPYVLALSLEERKQAEKTLVRKIHIRLIPMIILIYIVRSIPRAP